MKIDGKTLAELSIDTLNCLMFDVKNEIEKRKNDEKREAWKKVVNAICDFVEEFGPIIVYDDDNYSIHITEEYLNEDIRNIYRSVGRLIPAEEDEDE